MTSVATGTAGLLAALTHPLDTDTFVERFWPRQSFVGHGPVARFQSLAKIAELSSVEASLRAWAGAVRVWPPLDHGSRDARLATPDEALRLYRAGWTVYLNEAERSVPGLLPCVRRLEVELGLRYGSVATEIFASNAAAGAGAHCDFDFGFNVQLRGRKTWQMAPNTNFQDPHTSVSISDPFDPSVAAYSKGELPREMPRAGRQEFVTEAGAVVFIPRGHWHATRAHEPSFALTFACKGVPWCALMARHLEIALRQLEPWRAFPAAFRVGGPSARAANIETLNRRLAELKSMLEGLSAEALVDQWSQPPVPLYRISRASRPRLLHAVPTHVDGLCIRLLQADGTERLLQIPPEHAALVACTLECDFPIATRDLSALAHCTLEETEATVAALLGEGILEVL